MRICILLTILLGSSALALGIRDDFDSRSYASGHVLSRNVAVIGGGASGIYAAAYLRSLGKSVAVIEKESLIGGHTNTYIDAATGVSVNYGVQAFWNVSVTRDYFNLLGITYGPLQFSPSTRFFANFQTGKQVSGVQITFNFSAYRAQLDRYPYLLYGWDIPKPIPEDLLLPFGDFIKNYNLASSAFDIFSVAGGVGRFLNELTVNVFKFVDESFLDSFSGNSVVPVTNNGEIYTKASTLLGSDILLSSTVIAARRTDRKTGGVSLVVQTPSGKTLIQASKLLITIPPLVSTLRPFDLDSTEKSLFSKWSYSDYYTMLIKDTGLPSGYTFTNANESAASYHIPQLPAPYSITPTRVEGLYYIWYGSPVRVTEQQVKADVIAIVKRLRPTVNSTATADPKFVEFRSHSPFKLVVGAEEIKGGFYDKLEGLQGKRNTYWTGAAFSSHDAALLWNYTLPLVKKIAAT